MYTTPEFEFNLRFFFRLDDYACKRMYCIEELRCPIKLPSEYNKHTLQINTTFNYFVNFKTNNFALRTMLRV